MLAEQILQHARFSDDQVLMIRTVIGKDLTVAKVYEEKRCFGFGDGNGKPNGNGKAQGKGGYGCQAVQNDDEYPENWDEADMAWESHICGCEGGFDYEATEDEDYVSVCLQPGLLKAWTRRVCSGGVAGRRPRATMDSGASSLKCMASCPNGARE